MGKGSGRGLLKQKFCHTELRVKQQLLSPTHSKRKLTIFLVVTFLGFQRGRIMESKHWIWLHFSIITVLANWKCLPPNSKFLCLDFWCFTGRVMLCYCLLTGRPLPWRIYDDISKALWCHIPCYVTACRQPDLGWGLKLTRGPPIESRLNEALWGCSLHMWRMEKNSLFEEQILSLYIHLYIFLHKFFLFSSFYESWSHMWKVYLRNKICEDVKTMKSIFTIKRAARSSVCLAAPLPPPKANKTSQLLTSPGNDKLAMTHNWSCHTLADPYIQVE